MKALIELEKELVKSIALSKVIVSRYVVYTVSLDTIELSQYCDDDKILVLDLMDSKCNFRPMDKNEILDYVREIGFIDELNRNLIKKGVY